MNNKIPSIIGSLLLLASLSISGILLYSNSPAASAQDNADSRDAIAIRVIPNPYHLSALRWYQEQGISGSPQSLSVDGYDAVRDGRTVYVNAANVEAGTMYTNIYLISYNQEAQTGTIDIFGNILSHWKFNTNLLTPHECRINKNDCLIDDDCSIGDFCESEKARLIRDTRRLADLTDFEQALDDHKLRTGNYPTLSAGSYIPHYSLSVWPSWREALSQDLGYIAPLDPVNRLGSCLGYDKITCWNEQTKSFRPPGLPDLGNNSMAYVYNTDSEGLTASVCAVFETIYDIIRPPKCALDVCFDQDGDGYGRPASSLCAFNTLDCNDLDDTILDGEQEICSNNFDDDCDGMTDCDDPDCPACVNPVYCGDSNCDVIGGENCGNCPGDCGECPVSCPNGVCEPGLGECSSCYGFGFDCYCGNNAVECGEECDFGDTLPGDSCSPTCQWECSDDDGDLYIRENTSFVVCGNVCGGPSGGQACIGNNDCDDTPTTGESINPGAADICNGIDDDCNSTTPDGSGEAAPLNNNQSGVCNSSSKSCNGILGWQNNYAGIAGYEILESSCNDSRDNDCDDTCDNTDGACFAGSQSDSDCTGICNDSSESDFFLPGEADCNLCDHVGDDNTNQTFPADDPYNPGSQITTTEDDWVNADHDLVWLDYCDPACGRTETLVHLDIFEPGGETRCDGVDNDCDGMIDENCDNDGDNFCDNSMVLWYNNDACTGTAFVGNGTAGNDCDDQNDDRFPGNPETCGDGIDQDCDGSDLACPDTCDDIDHDGFDDCAIGDPDGDTLEIDCDDSNKFEWPGNPETCDGYDNDCSGDIDEICDNDGDRYCDENFTFYDNFTVDPFLPNHPCDLTITSSDDCNDNDPDIRPGAVETCHDGVDNNCNGEIDENCTNLCIFNFIFPCEF